MHSDGIAFAEVHDCFWTHACDVSQMNKVHTVDLVVSNRPELVYLVVHTRNIILLIHHHFYLLIHLLYLILCKFALEHIFCSTRRSAASSLWPYMRVSLSDRLMRLELLM